MKQRVKGFFPHLIILVFLTIASHAHAAGQRIFADATFYPTGTAPFRAAVADLNHDGIQDLAVSDGAGGVSVLLGKKNGGFQDPVAYAGGQSPEGIAFADINGDKALDILLADEVGTRSSFSVEMVTAPFSPP